MTRADIFVRIISDVFDKPHNEVADMLTTFRECQPEGQWDEYVPPDQARKLINDLRDEAPSMLASLACGVSKFAQQRSKM